MVFIHMYLHHAETIAVQSWLITNIGISTRTVSLSHMNSGAIFVNYNLVH